MTTLTEIFECAISDQHTDEDLINLVDYILTKVPTSTRDQYYMDNIGSSDAADVAFANESICEDYFEQHPAPLELIIKHLPDRELAYHLVFTEPTKATELLEELLYYHNHGRI